MSERSGRSWFGIFRRGESAIIPQLEPQRQYEFQDEPNPIDLEITALEQYVRRFRLPAEVRDGLNENQLKLLDIFEKTGECISDLYHIQRGSGNTPNFYPPRVTKNQILRAAKNNSHITDPDTVVRQNQDGTLEPISMYLAYAGPIKRIGLVQKLKVAQGVAFQNGDTKMSIYLGVKATSFENGNSELADQAWMDIEEEPPVDLAIGLYDTITDPYGIKEGFEGWATALDKKLTAESQPFADAYLKWWAKDTGQVSPKVKMRIGYPTFIAGQAYKENWTANNLPSRPERRQKYGSKFTFFETIFEINFREKTLPAFYDHIDPDRRIGIHEDLVKKVSRRKLIAHELVHSLDIPSDLNERFNEYALPLKELYCDLVSLDGYFNITDSALIESREREMALATFLSDGVLEYNAFKSAGKRKDYYFSNSVILTRLTDRKSVQIDSNSGRITWNNPRLAYSQTAELRREAQKLLHYGSFKDAEEFIGLNFDQEVYRPIALRENKFGPFTTSRDARFQTVKEPEDNTPATIVLENPENSKMLLPAE